MSQSEVTVVNNKICSGSLKSTCLPGKYCMISLTFGIKTVKLIDIGNRMVVSRGRGEGKTGDVGERVQSLLHRRSKL